MLESCNLKLIDVYSIGIGWQSGIELEVFFTANNPAVLDISRTSPFGILFSLMSSITFLFPKVIIDSAFASLKVLYLLVISTKSNYLLTFQLYSLFSKISLPKIGTVFFIISTINLVAS